MGTKKIKKVGMVAKITKYVFLVSLLFLVGSLGALIVSVSPDKAFGESSQLYFNISIYFFFTALISGGIFEILRRVNN